jgi:hypothetical protein
MLARLSSHWIARMGRLPSKGPTGVVFRVSTVPCDSKHLEPLHIPDADELVADDHFTGKVKRYIKPLAFGGDPSLGDNLT